MSQPSIRFTAPAWRLAWVFLACTLCLLASGRPAWAQAVAEAPPPPLSEPVPATGSRIVAPLPDDALYLELGGAVGLPRLVDEFVKRLVADVRIAALFKDTNLHRLRTTLTEQFCAVSGGGCLYSGDDMALVHRGMALNKVQFNALVEALQAAMDARRVPFAAQRRLLAKLAPMHREILAP